jgi:hypothetical protein
MEVCIWLMDLIVFRKDSRKMSSSPASGSAHLRAWNYNLSLGADSRSVPVAPPSGFAHLGGLELAIRHGKRTRYGLMDLRYFGQAPADF